MSQIEKAQAEYTGFTDNFQSAVICTISKDGIPNASYAPVVIDDAKNVYIYVSGLANHTQNIQDNPHVSVLFIDDEATTPQIFARRRLTFDCLATLIERDTVPWVEIVDNFQLKFGEIIEMLRSLPDFRIFKLTPQSGRFVIGFGSIYDVTGDNLDKLQPVTGGKG
ncbi:HugZ family pyridoxamine 5'-phosphate oxidase [Calothrix sp. 336/3]|uniref:HugZ family pyridoxamine 5'-phosphate oxidase n=1 Tax=Calothrix sp. 336/3 TaxID=1337936 RepID=UPI0004E3E6AD|nr:pyridoxamine 5'-phosphate oxidase family protein [Calothrix sp. 336/3]AKG23553.1 pyridoxamine 5-phosphate oxidase [Calothrix sp. 336/3]